MDRRHENQAKDGGNNSGDLDWSASEVKQGPEDLHEGWLTDPTQNKACNGDAKLAYGKIRVDVLYGMQGVFCTRFALPHGDLDLRPANANKSELRDDEEGVHRDEKNNQHKA